MSSSETRRAPLPSRETVAEAAAWITRLHSSQRTPEVEAGFRDWLAADEEHARAFEGMTDVWDMMPAVSAGEMPRVTVWERPARPRLWVRAAAVTMACAVLTVAAYLLWPNADYTTAVGEQRIVNLEDGTRVSMNSGTRMAVAYTEIERRIVLKEGEAFFEVAHNKRVPFIVIAGDHRVTAVGTAFSVRQEHNRTAVTLVEGKVTVAPVSISVPALKLPRIFDQGQSSESKVPESTTAPPPPPTFSLSPGQRLILVAARPPQLDSPRVEVVTAWRRGEVVLDETLLSDAVAEMNRYDKTPIVIDDPRIGQLPVSGIYRTGDSTGFADIVARMYDLRVVQGDGRIHLSEAVAETPH
jgi:transmembrane sensor